MISSFRALVELILAYAQQQPPYFSFCVSEKERLFFRSTGSPQITTLPSLSDPLIEKPPLQKSTIPFLELPIKHPPVPESTQVPEIENVNKRDSIPVSPMPHRAEGHREIRTILKKIAPALPLIDPPPDDHIARSVASSWKIALPEIKVLLLALSPSPDDLNFLKRLAKAIEGEHHSTKILAGERLEREKQWDQLFSKNIFRLILISPHFEKYPELLKGYTAIPAQKMALLHKVPCIPLQSASVYKLDKEAKILLWKEILQTLSSHVC